MIPGLVDHLWQSTLFAGAAWLLTLVLRKNRAQVRHGIWLTASVKFLVPFSLLVGLGSLAPRHAAAPPVQVAWVAAAEQISEPLTSLPLVAARVAPDRAGRNYLAMAAVMVWGGGFAAIAICWMVRWTRVQALRRQATPASVPGGIEFAVPVMSAPGLVGPGIFGFFRPVLLLPEGIGERLDRTQLDAILAHELCHVRRHDNLTAMIHMIVQAIFWFHPLLWWLGSRLVEERERACDEEVLRLGSKPRVYAEGILNVYKLYVESPLACVSGVTGSNLRRRIEAIMRNRRGLRLNFAKKLALSMAGIAALAAPIVVGILHAPVIFAQARAPDQPSAVEVAVPAPAPRMIAQRAAEKAPTPQPAAAAPPQPTLEFEVASVRALPPVPANTNGGFRVSGGPGTQDPEHIRYTQAAIFQILARTFSMQDDQFVAPDWITNRFGAERYEIIANVPPGATPEQANLMMENLLKERFHLAYHREKRNLDVYELVVAKGGSKLKDAEIPGELPVPTPGQPAKTYKGDDGYPNPPAGWPSGVGIDEQGPTQFFFSLRYPGFVLANLGPLFPASGRLSIWRFGMRMVSIPDLIAWMQSIEGIAHIVDHTGLTGQYDVKVRFSDGGVSGDGQASEPAPDFFEALEKQLGLKLQKTKALLDVIVIDHIDRTPVEN